MEENESGRKVKSSENGVELPWLERWDVDLLSAGVGSSRVARCEVRRFVEQVVAIACYRLQVVDR